MWHNEGPVGIGTLGLRAVWSRMNDGDVFHCNDVNVESTWTESNRWHATEQSLQLFHASQHLNGRYGRLVRKRCAHLERGVEELWLINKSDRGGAIERRDVLNLPARDVGKGDDRFGKGGDGIIEVGPDPEVQNKFAHVSDGSAA